ncbi:gluconokinase [Flavihumibacter fluvii]|uniref:gluconokinase n=1 Tax=Flavihumibacter fluvii TaxID=2838157 RepID=UPI001BDF482D|nr:gluconokinase [Flavihumibacter fluvii]ULQ53547.1 gluconokinase [Flavihumibacter fluvii]
MHYFAGLDIGTTHTKLVIATASLDIVFQEKMGYLRGFGATLDGDEIYQNITRLLENANRELDLSTNDVTIAISAAMHSLLLVDAAAVPLTPVYTWADTSSQPAMDALHEEPAAEALFSETGTPLHPMSPFCKLAWMKFSTPHVLAAAYKCIGIKELVWYRITGQWEIDHSLASATGLFSQQTLSWHKKAIEMAGITEGQLSLPVPITRTLVRGNFQWVIGASDGCLAQLGSGAMKKGTAALTIGTSGAIRMTMSGLWIDEKRELFTYLLDEDHFVCGGSTNNGGIVLEWWQEKVMEQKGETSILVNSFLSAAEKAEPGCDGLVCLPYFGGERAPVWDAAATGVFAGINNHHGQPEFKRAILEGIGFSFRLLLEKLEAAGGNVEKIFASGGFTQSAWWVQLMADILQKPMLLNAADADASAMGAIAVGLKAAGLISNWQEFADLLPPKHSVYEPDANTRETYFYNYQHFCRLCQY